MNHGGMFVKRKYRRGRRIRSVGEYEKSPAMFFRVLFGDTERTIHRGFLSAWQYHVLEAFTHRGWIWEAELMDDNEKNKERAIEYIKEKLSRLHPDEINKDHIGMMVEVGFLKEVLGLLKEKPKMDGEK